MNEKTLKALLEAGAIKRFHIIADGARFRVDADTQGGTITAATLRGSVKTWTKADSAARLLRNLGVGAANLDISRWRPEQKEMTL